MCAGRIQQQAGKPNKVLGNGDSDTVSRTPCELARLLYICSRSCCDHTHTPLRKFLHQPHARLQQCC